MPEWNLDLRRLMGMALALYLSHEFLRTGSTPGKIILINHHTGRCLLNFQFKHFLHADHYMMNSVRFLLIAIHYFF